MKRIGELLLARGVDPHALLSALADQPMTHLRLCSLLISRGQLDPDDASRALADQYGVAGALVKHLDGRDAAAAARLPAAIAHARFALPLGFTRTGELIICVRDPRPELHAALVQATGLQVMIAVAPATRLQELIVATYGAAPTAVVDGSIDVNFDNTGPIATAGFGALDVGGAGFQLVGLDDARVAKDHTQSGAHQMAATPANRPTPTTPPMRPPPLPPADPGVELGAPTARATPIARADSPLSFELGHAGATPRAHTDHDLELPDPVARPGQPAGKVDATPASGVAVTRPRSSVPPMNRQAPISLDDTTERLELVNDRDAATDIALTHVASRFVASLFVIVQDGIAQGMRGHGPAASAVATFGVPTASPSQIKLAIDTRRLATEIPAGPVQGMLQRVLGNPSTPTAAPILVGHRVVGVIAVGDPPNASELEDARDDLRWLAEALGLAYSRLLLEDGR